ncbi:MAG: hypothetical protein ACE5QV_09715 [Fidelibacterota bacterium]
MLRKFIILISIITLSSGSVPGMNEENKKVERIKRDLKIMEVVLDELLKGLEQDYFRKIHKTKGFYLEDYGVIFTVPIYEPSHIKYSISYKKEKKSYTMKGGKEGMEKLDKLKEKLAEFFGSYADAINYLDPENRITVYIYESYSEEPILIATAWKKDIIDFRTGRINREKFKSSIKYQPLLDETDLESQINIMANIIDTALKRKSEANLLSPEGSVKGMFLEKFGALFVMHTTPGSDLTISVKNLDRYLKTFEMQMKKLKNFEITLEGKRTIEERYDETLDKKEELLKEYQENLEKFKSTLIELLGSYGPTLRRLNDNKWIAVIANLKDLTELDLPDQKYIVLKVRKKDVDEYNREKISYKDFVKRINYTEY